MMINNRSTCATGRRLPGSLRIWSTLTRASFWGGCGRDGFLAVTGGVCCLQRDRSRALRNLSVRLQRITVTKARDLRVKHGNPRTSVPDVLQFGRQRAPSRFSHARPKKKPLVLSSTLPTGASSFARAGQSSVFNVERSPRVHWTHHFRITVSGGSPRKPTDFTSCSLLPQFSRQI
jgi:hypothetical protein